MTLAQERHELKPVQDLEQEINEMQDAIGDASTDKALPRSMPVKIRAMQSLLSKAKYQIYNCPSTVKKLMTMLHIAEKNTHLLKKKSIYLSQIAAKTVPKGLHYLSTNKGFLTNKSCITPDFITRHYFPIIFLPQPLL